VSKTKIITGRVKWFSTEKGYGFIEPDPNFGDPDAFVHISAVEKASMPPPKEGDRLAYELVPSRNGKVSAENLAWLRDVAGDIKHD
jgi:cold shock protein